MPEELNAREPGLSEAQRALERRLKSLVPAAAAMDRDALMYAAGRASAQPHRLWWWQTASAVLAAICAGVIVMRPPPRVIERQVVVHDSPVPPGAQDERPGKMETLAPATWLAPERDAESGYFQMREALLTRGVDAILPMPADNGASAGVPAKMRKFEGIDALPAWQRRMLEGGHS